MQSIAPSIRSCIADSFAVAARPPSLGLYFYRNAYSMGAIGSMPSDRSFSDLITFTRSSGGGRFNSSGVFEWVANDVPRFDYDPVTLQPLGILIEEARTNRLLNSATVVTQNVSTTATANTLSFYGTGTINLSGTATGSLVGTGAANRVSLTFTPTAGTLTLTVTGDCTSGQLEVGGFETSYIPTAGSAVTRAADVASVNTLSPWYNASEGTLFVEATRLAQASLTQYMATLSDNTSAGDSIRLLWNVTAVNSNLVNDGVTSSTLVVPAPVGITRAATSWDASQHDMAVNGVMSPTDTSVVVPETINRLYIGVNAAGNSRWTNGHIRSLRYWPRRLSNAELQQVTA